jgi:hypothetical protein
MKKIIFILLLFPCFLKAQVYQAGTVFPYYIDVNPDTVINCFQVYPNPPDENHFFDVNGDNQNDVKIHSMGFYSPGGTVAYIDVVPLNANLFVRLGRVDSVYHGWYGYWWVTNVAKPLQSGDTINKASATWTNSTLVMTDKSGNAGTYKNITDWVNTADQYIGIKYQTATDTLYAWIRVFFPDPCKCHLKDYSIFSSCNSMPSLTVASSSSMVCSSESVTLSASGANTYSWSTGQTTSSIVVTPTVTTTYTVNGSSVGCTASSVISQTVDACIGIKELERQNVLNVYPNPATSHLNITSGQMDLSNSEISILNSLGQIVLKTDYANTIDASQFASGVYTLKLTNSQQSYYKKFVKE